MAGAFHSDPLILEYLTENAWSPLSMSLEQLTERFCTRRYGQLSECMNETWQDALPIIKLVGWGGYSRREKGDPDWEKYVCSWTAHREMWSDLVIVFPIRCITIICRPTSAGSFPAVCRCCQRRFGTSQVG